MKISVSQYAKSLFESLSGKTEKEVKVVLKKFVAILGRNRDLNKAEGIMEIFSALWNAEHGELPAELLSARELGPTARETVINYLKEKTGAKKIMIKEEIDRKLLGGFVLKYESKVLDGSLKASLEELKKELIG